MIDEFEVREMLGVAHIYNPHNGNVSTVLLSEGDERITITQTGIAPPQLNPSEARRMARHLYRLARRIEARAQA